VLRKLYYYCSQKYYFLHEAKTIQLVLILSAKRERKNDEEQEKERDFLFVILASFSIIDIFKY
jgi:hypothetical protein